MDKRFQHIICTRTVWYVHCVFVFKQICFFSVRYVDENFVMRSTALNLTANCEKHDASFYRQMITNQMGSWGLSADKIIGVTTDSDSAQSAVSDGP
jgi:hypothetical protein